MTEARKVNLAKESFQRPPINAVKASDGAGKPQAKHKNKIPKALRYDLENALVGLCDVWFEEIKPYLERNNIKLHVHGTEAGGGDPEAVTECSHLDPGSHDRRQRRSANYAGCCSTPPTVSRAQCLKPLPQPASSHKRETLTERPCRKQQERKKSRKERRTTVSQSPPRPLVPRLCRTYSIPPQHVLTNTSVPSNNEVLPKLIQRSRLGYPLQKSKQFKDASTQTDGNVAKKEKPQLPLIKKREIKIDVPNTVNIKPRSPSAKFGKCQATTCLFSSKIKTKEQATLFKDDLIDIIRERHNKRLKILYTNPSQQEYPSVMNLYSPTTNTVKPKRAFKPPHWR